MVCVINRITCVLKNQVVKDIQTISCHSINNMVAAMVANVTANLKTSLSLYLR